MYAPDVDPMDPRVLERNYDYAQRNVRLLSRWYDREIDEMVELLARHGIELSRNDRLQFGLFYQAIRESSDRLE
ncbi:hypothetical protein [Natrarchaeobaculum aegyptiacum]|uniref:Uncharacterized protein n=1 Tax=Natrarchaeobaculum aegyptiacum TaxID=745377 RepID=A0A2Z2HVN1_9EURY|nr:hypothetical protein [Natrarchaeobaculum aegyptiacum]ARS89587.1 hypothetical protein B1756_07430 [Natrarchaeobaculum aegyptiacum]